MLALLLSSLSFVFCQMPPPPHPCCIPACSSKTAELQDFDVSRRLQHLHFSTSATWSSYKSQHGQVHSTPWSCHFVSTVLEGSISDREITEQSGLLELLERGDSVMADKGFNIRDLLVPLGVKLNIPPFKQGSQKMTPIDISSTKKIASVRIHVERKMERIKNFQLVSHQLDNTMFDFINPMIFVCSCLTSFQPAPVM